MHLLEINNLYAGYNGKEILKGISFSIPKGSFIGIIGPNGAGKTTLFRVITRVIKPLRGTIYYQGKNINNFSYKSLAREIAVFPQILDTPFSYSVEEFVFMGRFPHLKMFEKLKKVDIEIVEKVMIETNIFHLRERNINTISAGERQRVILAQALAQEPNLLLLDEPTSHLDISHQIEILDLITKLNKENALTIAIIFHDLNLASEYCNQLILLNEGKVYKIGTPEEVLTSSTLQEVYKTQVVIAKSPISSKPHVFLGVKS